MQFQFQFQFPLQLRSLLSQSQQACCWSQQWLSTLSPQLSQQLCLPRQQSMSQSLCSQVLRQREYQHPPLVQL